MWVYGNQLCCVGTIKTLRYRLLNRSIYPPRLIVMDVIVCLRAESCSPDWLIFPVLGGRFHWGATLWCHVTRAKCVMSSLRIRHGCLRYGPPGPVLFAQYHHRCVQVGRPHQFPYRRSKPVMSAAKGVETGLYRNSFATFPRYS